MDFKSIFLGVLFSLIWSSAFTSARILMSSAPPFLVLSLRFLISGMLGVAIARLLGQNFNLSRQEWTGLLIFGLLLSVLLVGTVATFFANYIKNHKWVGVLGLVVIIFVAIQLIIGGTNEFYPDVLPSFILKII